MKHRVIEAPGMGPIFLQNADYNRISDLAEYLCVSETEVIQRALKCYEYDLHNEVAYVCDRKNCDPCPGLECHHTLDIHHAKNFTEIEPGRFMENK